YRAECPLERFRRREVVNCLHTIRLPPSSNNQHTVAIAEETITFRDGMLVRIKYQTETRKSCHEYQQARLRQMKVGQESVNCAKSIARIYEELCRALLGNYRTIVCY